MSRIGLVFILFLVGCSSYYGEYEREYYIDSGESNYFSPYNDGYANYSGRAANAVGSYMASSNFRGLTTDDFYMMDNYPREYFNSQLLSGFSSLNRYVIHSLFQSLPR